jgi:hypothetical protein
MEVKDLVGKRKFTATLEYDMSLQSDGRTFNCTCTPDKKMLKRLMKGVKLTTKYLRKMEKFGYKLENVHFEESENE